MDLLNNSRSKFYMLCNHINNTATEIRFRCKNESETKLKIKNSFDYLTSKKINIDFKTFNNEVRSLIIEIDNNNEN